MGLLGGLIRTALDIAVTPLDIVSDVINIGNDDHESQTVKRIEQIGKDIVDVTDDLI